MKDEFVAGIVSKSTKQVNIKAGDYVYHKPDVEGYKAVSESIGEGVVVGFCANSGEPCVYFYSKQDTIIISADALLVLYK